METIEWKGKTYKVLHCGRKGNPCRHCWFNGIDWRMCPHCGGLNKHNKKGDVTAFAYFVPVRKRRERPDLVVALVAIAAIFLMVLLASFTIPAR